MDEVAYKIGNPKFKASVGSAYFVKSAGEGAVFVLIPYQVKNVGNESLTIASDSFILKSGDTEYSPDNEAITALMMSGKNGKDFLLSQLHPGIQKKTITAYRIPTELAKGPLSLMVKGHNIFSGTSAKVALQ